MGYGFSFAEYVVKPVLRQLAFDEDVNAVAAFLTGIAAAESGLRYVKQKRGPALSVYQIEPATHDDIRRWAERKSLLKKLDAWLIPGVAPLEQLPGNAYYATAVARMFWRRLPDPLPQFTGNINDFIKQCARLWKLRYNTVHGAGTEHGFVAQAGPVIADVLSQHTV